MVLVLRYLSRILVLAVFMAAGGSARADIRAQIAACPEAGCRIQLEAGKSYVETEPWNLRGKRNLSISGSGALVYFDFHPAKTPGVAIDASGASRLHFEGWGMALASKSGRPDVGLLLARNIENKSSGDHHFERWRIQGWYKKAAVVAIASEVNVWTHCFISNSEPDAVVYWTGRENDLDVRSQFGLFGTGSTNTCHDFFATGFGHYGMVYGENLAGRTIVLGDGTHDFHLRGGTMSMRGKEKQGAVGGRCALQLGSLGKRPVVNVLLDGVEWETVGARNAILVSRQVEGLTIRAALLEATEAVIRIERDGALHDSVLQMSRLIGGIGQYDVAAGDDAIVVVQGRVRGCRFDLQGRRLVPLARDIAGRCRAALFVSPGASFKENVIHVWRKADVTDAPRIDSYNDIHVWER